MPRKVVAIDCEFVGGKGGENLLARVSIVDDRCQCLYDQYVKPDAKVVDYRTAVSGVRAGDLEHARGFKRVRREVRGLIMGRRVVGHDVEHDFAALDIDDHPDHLIRDTADYAHFRRLVKSGSRRPKLKTLARELLGKIIQEGEHDSVTDAAVVMELYQKYKVNWERNL